MTEPQTLTIAGRAISTLLLNQGAGEAYRIYRTAQDSGAAFNYLSIPPGFPYAPRQAFDPEYQERLFDVGAALGRGRIPWLSTPPDLVPSAERPRQPKRLRAIPGSGDNFTPGSFFGSLLR